MAMYSEGSGTVKLARMRQDLRNEARERLLSNLDAVLSCRPVDFYQLIDAIDPLLAGRHMTFPDMIDLVNLSITPQLLRLKSSLTDKYAGYAAELPLNESLELVDLDDEIVQCTLVLKEKSLWLYTPIGHTRLKVYKSTGSRSYKALRALYEAGRALTIGELGIGGKTPLKGLPRNMGFIGDLKVFIEFDFENRTLRLVRNPKITLSKLEDIKKMSTA
jgi:hypothetical protein